MLFSKKSGPAKFDPIMRVTRLNVTRLSGLHCTTCYIHMKVQKFKASVYFEHSLKTPAVVFTLAPPVVACNFVTFWLTSMFGQAHVVCVFAAFFAKADPFLAFIAQSSRLLTPPKCILIRK